MKTARICQRTTSRPATSLGTMVAMCIVFVAGAFTREWTDHDTGEIAPDTGWEMYSVGPNTNVQELGIAIVYRNACYAVQRMQEALEAEVGKGGELGPAIHEYFKQLEGMVDAGLELGPGAGKYRPMLTIPAMTKGNGEDR